jgi:cardiolipin synthase
VGGQGEREIDERADGSGEGMGRSNERTRISEERTRVFRLRDATAPPNIISLVRLALVPVALWLLWTGERTPAIVVLLVMAATDGLDGYVARRTGRVTELGRVLDPLADKVGIDAVLILLAVRGEFPVPALAFLLARDAVIVTAALLVARRLGGVPSSNMVGKVTFVVLAALVVVYAADLSVLESPMLVLAMVAAALSLVSYWRSAADALRRAPPAS